MVALLGRARISSCRQQSACCDTNLWIMAVFDLWLVGARRSTTVGIRFTIINILMLNFLSLYSQVNMKTI
jgi:hypothetical protein